jgi:hypothetical protein
MGGQIRGSKAARGDGMLGFGPMDIWMSGRQSSRRNDPTTAEVYDNVNGQIKLASFSETRKQESPEHLRHPNGTL